MAELPAEEFDFDRIVEESQAHIRAYIAGLGVPRHDVDDVARTRSRANRIPVRVKRADGNRNPRF